MVQLRIEDKHGLNSFKRGTANQLLRFLLVVSLIFLNTTVAMAACRISDFWERDDIASLSEIERVAYVTQMTRTEFSRFHKAEAGELNYYPLITSSANLLQARQRAQATIDALGLEHGDEYAKFWASNLLRDEALKEYTMCLAGQTVGLWIRAREVKPGLVKMYFAHTRPVGVGPYPITVTSSINIKNIDILSDFLRNLGPRDQYFGEAFTLLLGDSAKPASLTMKFGEETPRTLYIPASTAPEVASFQATPLERGESFRDCEVCPEMMTLSAGRYLMGASLEEDLKAGLPPQLAGKSIPLHEVEIGPGYAIGKYEVTVEEFRLFVESTGYQASDYCTVNLKINGVWVYEPREGYNWRKPSYEYTDRYPVTCVTWEDAKAYTDWLSRKTGIEYSLPTEAIYEYAARAGTTTPYFWGEDPKDRDKACLYSNQADLTQDRYLGTGASGDFHRFQCDDGYPVNSPVGSFKPNPWGLYDILGNVWEWTEDCWNDDFEGAPTDGSAWREGDCDARAMRGGSSGNTPRYARVGNRALFLVDYAGHSLGFRVMSKR